MRVRVEFVEDVPRVVRVVVGLVAVGGERAVIVAVIDPVVVVVRVAGVAERVAVGVDLIGVGGVGAVVGGAVVANPAEVALALPAHAVAVLLVSSAAVAVLVQPVGRVAARQPAI